MANRQSKKARIVRNFSMTVIVTLVKVYSQELRRTIVFEQETTEKAIGIKLDKLIITNM